MKRRINIVQSLPAFLAVTLLVLVSSSHIHLRYCLDGTEAPVSFHFESEKIHSSNLVTIDNLGEENLADIESELSMDSVLVKFSKSLTDSVAILAFDIPTISKASKKAFQIVGREILPDRPETLLPPARAPPAIA